MSERHALASEGAWVELRDVRELTYGDRQTAMRAVRKNDDGMGPGLDITNALIALLVVNWQLPQPLPMPSQDPSVIQRLGIEDGVALEALVTPALKVLFPDSVEPETPEAQAQAMSDPASPTVPSVDS